MVVETSHVMTVDDVVLLAPLIPLRRLPTGLTPGIVLRGLALLTIDGPPPPTTAAWLGAIIDYNDSTLWYDRWESTGPEEPGDTLGLTSHPRHFVVAYPTYYSYYVLAGGDFTLPSVVGGSTVLAPEVRIPNTSRMWWYTYPEVGIILGGITSEDCIGTEIPLTEYETIAAKYFAVGGLYPNEHNLPLVTTTLESLSRLLPQRLHVHFREVCDSYLDMVKDYIATEDFDVDVVLSFYRISDPKPPRDLLLRAIELHGHRARIFCADDFALMYLLGIPAMVEQNRPHIHRQLLLALDDPQDYETRIVERNLSRLADFRSDIPWITSGPGEMEATSRELLRWLPGDTFLCERGGEIVVESVNSLRGNSEHIHTPLVVWRDLIAEKCHIPRAGPALEMLEEMTTKEYHRRRLGIDGEGEQGEISPDMELDESGEESESSSSSHCWREVDEYEQPPPDFEVGEVGTDPVVRELEEIHPLDNGPSYDSSDSLALSESHSSLSGGDYSPNGSVETSVEEDQALLGMVARYTGHDGSGIKEMI